jgi:hypothetical protein
VFIGRANDCQIQTQDGLVSRRHAKVVYDGAYWIEDNGSANGVYVGAERVQRYKLRAGESFRCGHLEVRFEVEEMNRTAIGAAPGHMVPLSAPIAQSGKLAAATSTVVPPPPQAAAPAVAPPAPPTPPPSETPPAARPAARPAPSASSVPPAAAPPAAPAPTPPPAAPAPAVGIGDPSGAMGGMTMKLQAQNSGIVRPPPPPPGARPSSGAVGGLGAGGPPPAAPSLGFPEVPPVTNVPSASAELAALRGELEGERRRRAEVEEERNSAKRYADDAQRRSEELTRRSEELQRKLDELSARANDGESERLRRRIEQLESEVRRKGAGVGSGDAQRAVEAERDRLRARVAELESQSAAQATAAATSSAASARVTELEAAVKKLSEERDAADKQSAAARQSQSEELERMRRRVEQLESEARRRPVGSVSDEKRLEAQRIELETALRQLRDLERERDSLREIVAKSSGPAKPPQPVIDSLTAISDGLADMRAALRAAGDEVALEQLEQVRNALRQASTQLGISL